MDATAPTTGDKIAGGLLALGCGVVVIFAALDYKIDLPLVLTQIGLSLTALAGGIGMMRGRKWAFVLAAIWAAVDSLVMLFGQRTGHTLFELDLVLGLLSLVGFYALLRLFGIFGPKPS